MFFWEQVSYRLLRTRVQTVLLLLVFLLSELCVGVYIGNIQANEENLKNLSVNLPVSIRILNRAGDQEQRLAISTEHFEKFSELAINNIHCTADAAGAYTDDARSQEPFQGGDVYILGANTVEAISSIDHSSLRMAAGVSEDFLTGKVSFCLVSQEFAERAEAKIGGMLSLEMYSAVCNPYGNNYKALGEQQLMVVGLYENIPGEDDTPDLVCPINWLRSVAKRKKAEFCYSSAWAEVANPLELTQFKKDIKATKFSKKDMRFSQVGSKTQFFECDAISIEDELFIKTAENFQSILRSLRQMLIPFLCLLAVIVVMLVLLVLRNSRWEMAVTYSLGESKRKIQAVQLCALVILEILSSLIALPILVLAIKIAFLQALVILLLGLGVTVLGSVTAIHILLRFDPMTLLTKGN